MKATDGADGPGPVGPDQPAFEQPLQEAAGQFEPRVDAVRLTEIAHATDVRRQRRAVRLMCVAGALFGAGVIGLALPVRMDAGKISVGLPLPGTSIPPPPTTTTPPSSFVAFTTNPKSAEPVTTPAPATAAPTAASASASLPHPPAPDRPGRPQHPGQPK